MAQLTKMGEQIKKVLFVQTPWGILKDGVNLFILIVKNSKSEQWKTIAYNLETVWLKNDWVNLLQFLNKICTLGDRTIKHFTAVIVAVL